jgi:hypothetical protein
MINKNAKQKKQLFLGDADLSLILDSLFARILEEKKTFKKDSSSQSKARLDEMAACHGKIFAAFMRTSYWEVK